jgi:endonuclease/exonuclease/phosphatase (EEP) superfamily protein YafD
MTLITVLTWNVLSQTTVPAMIDRPWKDRLVALLHTLIAFDADVVFLQEVDLAGFEQDFSSLFEDYYYACHHISKKRKLVFGNATLWRRSLFPHAITTEERSRTLHVILSDYFLLSNVHLPAEGGFVERRKHISSCQKVWLSNPHLPVIVGGDFNAHSGTPDGIFQSMLELGFQGLRVPNKFTHLSLRSGIKSDLDHVFISGVSIQLESTFAVGSEIDPHLLGTPSDHKPVIAIIRVVRPRRPVCDDQVPASWVHYLAWKTFCGE